MKHTHKLQFLIETKDSILIGKYIQQMRGKYQAQLGLGLETGSILIKEKGKHLSKTSDRVSRKCFGVSARGLSREGFLEVYIDNRRIFVIVYSDKEKNQV
jgi:hypothetical protein